MVPRPPDKLYQNGASTRSLSLPRRLLLGEIYMAAVPPLSRILSCFIRILLFTGVHQEVGSEPLHMYMASIRFAESLRQVGLV